MKKIINLILLFIAMSTLSSFAQPQVEMSSKNSFKGRRELRKENRVHNSTENLAEKNERKSRRKNNLGTMSNYKAARKEVVKERRRAKKESKTKEAITHSKKKEDKPSE